MISWLNLLQPLLVASCMTRMRFLLSVGLLKGCFYRCASVCFGIWWSHPHSHTDVPPSLSLSSTVSIIDSSSIVSPLLSFIKAHRLRGCTTNLNKQLLLILISPLSLMHTNFCGTIVVICWNSLVWLFTQDAVLTNGMLLKLHLKTFFLVLINWTKMTNSSLLWSSPFVKSALPWTWSYLKKIGH